jgi:hypothetical protein
MRYDSQVSLLALNLVTLCFGCEPKAKVVIMHGGLLGLQILLHIIILTNLDAGLKDH